MNSITIVIGFFILTVTSSTLAADSKAELIKADADFSSFAQKVGVAEAFAAYIAPDGGFLDIDPAKQHGQAAAAAKFKGVPPDFVLKWIPQFADASAQGDLGYTWGTYESRRTGKDGIASVRTGKYVTIWKRQTDGSWKFVMDTGTPDPDPEKASP